MARSGFLRHSPPLPTYDPSQDLLHQHIPFLPTQLPLRQPAPLGYISRRAAWRPAPQAPPQRQDPGQADSRRAATSAEARRHTPPSPLQRVPPASTLGRVQLPVPCEHHPDAQRRHVSGRQRMLFSCTLHPEHSLTCFSQYHGRGRPFWRSAYACTCQVFTGSSRARALGSKNSKDARRSRPRRRA